MKNIITLFISVLLFTSCNAQSEKKTDVQKEEISKEQIDPKVDYKVNKKYDDEGNLIGYDSTYTYYYSNVDKDAMLQDSVFEKFSDHFNMGNSLMGDDFFHDFFDEKNFPKDEFFKEDFFSGDVKSNQEMINRMLSRMDSLKNKFFIETYPLKQNETPKNKTK